ncbi:unnamed protein product [Candidula unifasciata]|uniref:Uncharacterized protein n=1 Tax=Candidula unifasciata TaxID=100452 RepID=A0A8S3ZPM8_9EUPU|nr:unnamed protein product [Candidula unifasciata]
MASQQSMSPEQLQHIIQQHHQGLQPSLQQLLQQQSTAMHHIQQQKVHEQLLHSLNEQLQMNLMHQAQILKDPTGAGSKWAGASINNQSLQALLMQHQQIMQQIQLVQRQFVLASALQPFGLHQGKSSCSQ